MAQTYQARRRAQDAPAARLESVPSRVPQYGGGSGGDLAGRTDVAPLSASAVPAGVGGVMQAKKKSDIANEAWLSERNTEEIDNERDLRQAKARYQYSRMSPGRPMPYASEFDDYLRAALPGRTADAQEAMLDTFLKGDREGISRYLAADIKRLNSDQYDFSGLLSDDLQTRADAYVETGQSARQMREVYNLLNSYWDLNVVGDGEDQVDTDTLKAFNRKAENTIADYDYTSEYLLATSGTDSEISKKEQEDYLRIRRKGKGGRWASRFLNRKYRRRD